MFFVKLCILQIDDTENANTITAQNEGLSIKNQSSSVSEKNINSMVNPINQPSQSEQIRKLNAANVTLKFDFLNLFY